jgi:DNA-binding transcriptional regulator YiaG
MGRRLSAVRLLDSGWKQANITAMRTRKKKKTSNSPHPRDKALGERIRYLRMQAKTSQEELGRKCGVTNQQVQKYETAHTRVAWSRLCLLAEALSISVPDLISPLV